MKIFIAFLLFSTGASAACGKRDQLKAAGDFLRKHSEKGSFIGVKAATGPDYFYNVDSEDSASMYHESGKLRVTEVKGKCHVVRLQQQKSTQSKI